MWGFLKKQIGFVIAVFGFVLSGIGIYNAPALAAFLATILPALPISAPIVAAVLVPVLIGSVYSAFLSVKNNLQKKHLVRGIVHILKKDQKAFSEVCMDAPLAATFVSRQLSDDKGYFTEDNLSLMKRCKLKDMKYEFVEGDTNIFKIIFGEINFIFSNRFASTTEVRGKFLQDALDGLQKENPELSLYDALERLTHDPARFVSFYTPMVTYDREVNGLNIAEDKITPVFNRLSSVCVQKLSKLEEIARKSGLAAINKIIAEKTEEIVRLSLDEKISADKFWQIILRYHAEINHGVPVLEPVVSDKTHALASLDLDQEKIETDLTQFLKKPSHEPNSATTVASPDVASTVITQTKHVSPAGSLSEFLHGGRVDSVSNSNQPADDKPYEHK